MIQDLQEVADPAGQDCPLPHESVEGGDGAHARPEGDRPLQGPTWHPQGGDHPQMTSALRGRGGFSKGIYIEGGCVDSDF